MIKLSDVAQKADVSNATASMVFNGRPGVNAATRDRVLAAAAELGYLPNNVARNLAMKGSRSIGLAITDIENPFFGSLTRYINEHASLLGYTTLIALSNDQPKEEDRIIGNFVGDRVAGIIIVPVMCQRSDYQSYELLKRRNIPYVFATSFYLGLSSEYVMTDLELGSYRLTRYLLDLGHREIVHLVSADKSAPLCSLRLAGYERAFAEKGLTPDPSLIIRCEKPDFHSGYLATKNFLDTRQADALLAINDILALGAKKAIRERGLSIPDDLSVAGYDDLIFSSITDTPLTTVRQNIEQIAKLSVQRLVNKIDGSLSETSPLLIEPDLMVRESTGPVRVR